MFWWPIAKHLADFLAARPEFGDDWSVYPGSLGSAKQYPCIEVGWDDEAGLSLGRPDRGNLTLWVDIWVLSDEVEPAGAYQQQYDAQAVVRDCLLEWSDLVLKELGLSCKVECPGIASQGTITRPSFGCRMIITIEWRKGRYGGTQL